MERIPPSPIGRHQVTRADPKSKGQTLPPKVTNAMSFPTKSKPFSAKERSPNPADKKIGKVVDSTLKRA